MNQILTDFSHAILRELIDKVRNANHGYYGIILDETFDISTEEQISICSQIIQEDFLVEELFFGFHQTSATSSDLLYAIIKDVLLRFQFSIKKCRGQRFDGAANVSGHVTGLHTTILQEESRATYSMSTVEHTNLILQSRMH